MFIYGLYARGYSDPDIEMKLLLLIREGDREKKDEISHMGYMLDMEGYFVAPFIDIYTRAEWAEQKRLGTGFYKSMTNDGIRVT
jgi:hypothetical protein